MHARSRTLPGAAAIAVALGLTVGTALAAPEPAAAQLPVWRVTEITPGDASVDGIAYDGTGGAVAAGTSWVRENGEVVGYAPTVFTRESPTDAWRQQRLKAAGPWSSLRDVAAVGPGSGIAVGTYDAASGGFLTAHGTKGTWETGIAPAPSGLIGGRLEDVDASAANDAWAAGTIDYAEEGPGGSAPQQPIVSHWDGRTWTKARLPAPPAAGWTGFEAVEAVAPNDVWAAGHAYDGAAPPLAHFDGTQWKYVPLPYTGGSFWAGITSLLARGADDVWALGFMQDAETFEERALVWHFDGKAWNEVEVPADFRITDATLTPTGVAALSMSRSRGPGVERFDGARWTHLNLPHPGKEAQQPTAIGYENGRVTVAAMRWVETDSAPTFLRTVLLSTQD